MEAARGDRRRTDTRRRLLRAADDLFRRRGIGSVGIAEVCRTAGVTKGVFTHHFPGGKDELVGAVVARNGALVRTALERSADRARPAPELVEGLFRGYARAMRAGGVDYGCPVAAGVVDASARSPATRRAAGDAFASWCRTLAARCPDDVAELAVASLEGAILLARAADDPALVTRVGRTLGGLLDG